MNVDVISKATGAVTQMSSDAIDLDAPSIVRLDLSRSAVAGFVREGHDLVIQLADGQQIRIVDFYPVSGDSPNDLVLREADGTQWVARLGGGAHRFSLVDDLETLIAAHDAGGGGSALALPVALLGGLAAAGGIVAAASGGEDSDDDGATGSPSDPGSGTGTTPPDREAPAAPSATIGSDGRQIIGRGEAGATVQVRDATGAVIGTAVVGADGSYTIALPQPMANGEKIVVTQTDPAGNVSPATSVAAPDTTAPTAPTAVIDAAGATVTGRGEAGATITIRDPSGAVIGTAVVAADGVSAKSV